MLVILAKLAALVVRALTIGLSGGRQRDTFVLMAPSVEGSRGDAAMMEVLLRDLHERYHGRVVILCYRRTERYADFVREYGAEVSCLEALMLHPVSLRRLLHRTHTFRFIGADIVDGFYSPLTTILRLSVAQAFARAGSDARIVSFSFSSASTASVSHTWKQLPLSLGLTVRDPQSRRRLAALLGRDVAQTADLAFLLQRDERGIDEAAGWVAAERGRGQTLIGIGVNALLLDAAGRRALGAVVTHLALHDERLSFLLVAHDVRTRSSDLLAAEDTARHIAPGLAPRIEILRQPYGPRQLKAIAGRLDAVVSGRMHFAIAALSQGVPAFCFQYNGKVEGLLELVGLGDDVDDVSVASDALGESWERVADGIGRFLGRREELAARVAGRLQAVTTLAAATLSYPRLEAVEPAAPPRLH
jgi:polysaccharide pyruvyl transferase WcaK-like protein